ncbi:MAG: hypothetical protein VR68_11635 [Peptococcaceae bacterium BRH_c4a]|nr:MAG: hypothetical protein VR68_11635 [Peptococcaceae bacterium BRH_c4a]
MLYMIKWYGESALINGTDQAYVILMAVGGHTDRKYVESIRDGLIAATSGLVSGDTLEYSGSKYLVTTTPPASQGITSFQCVKTNAVLAIKRLQGTYDVHGNVTGQNWVNIVTDIPAYAEPTFQRMFQEDPGMVPRQSFQITLQATNDVRSLDRAVFSGANYQVDTIDSISSPGNKIIEVSSDTRT